MQLIDTALATKYYTHVFEMDFNCMANIKLLPETKGIVSVIIPLFNRISYIAETIQSVIDQDYPKIELIVVDDGSNDGSYELAQGLAHEHSFTLITHPKRANKGQSAALNLGLSNAKGEFIAILDSDDLFEPGKISAQVAAFQKYPNAGLVYGLGTAIDATGERLYPILSNKHQETNEVGAILLDCYFLLPQNSLVRKSVYAQTGYFDESLRAAQDHDMLVRMAEVTKFHFEPQLYFKYRRHGDSISTTGLVKRWSAGFVILQKANARFQYPKNIIRKRKAVLHFQLGRALINLEKKYIKGILHIFYSGVLDPVRAAKVILRHEKVM